MYKKIHSDFIQSKKTDKDKSLFLSFVIGELDGTAKLVDGKKVVANETVIATLKRLLGKNAETIELITDVDSAAYKKAQKEKEWIMEYLPEQLSPTELTAIIKENATDMPSAMKYLKANHAGSYDGEVAARLAKEIFKKEKAL